MSDPIDTIWMAELFQASPVGMAIFDDQGNIAWANPKLASLLGLSLNQLISLNRTKAVAYNIGMLFDRPDAIDFESNGTVTRSLSCEYRTLTAPNRGKVEAAFYQDITENRQLRDRVDRLVLSDDKTGTLNLRGLMRDLEPLISRCRRYENDLSLIQFEFDFPTGADVDAGMLKISRGIRSELRWADLVSRNAENSFLLVLPETNVEAAQQLGSKLLTHLENLPDVELPACFCATAGWQRGNDAKMLLERIGKGVEQARQNNELVVAA